jgi:hypothetical protein
MPLATGTRLGPFEVLGKLGEGGAPTNFACPAAFGGIMAARRAATPGDPSYDLPSVWD